MENKEENFADSIFDDISLSEAENIDNKLRNVGSNSQVPTREQSYSLSLEAQTLVAGEIFGRYKIESELGRGGMGVVYKAYDTKLNTYVALKIVTDISKNFLNEASAIAQLNHPNIVRFYETGESPKPYLTMEYIEGVTLADLIRKKKIKTSYLVDIMIKLCNALFLAHKNKILHRDIKSSNIMITKEGEPKIMDFGLAKITQGSIDRLSHSEQAFGTLTYMSPEQAEGAASEKSDIYSIGATIYEAITFRPVFQSNSDINLIYQILNQPPIPPRELNPDISPYLEAICLKCIHKKPQKRYKNFKRLAMEFKNFKQRKPLIAKKYSNLDKIKVLVSKNKLLFGFIFTTLLMCLIFIVVLISVAQRAREAEKFALENARQLKEAKNLIQQEKDTATKSAKELKKLNQAMLNSLQYLAKSSHSAIYQDENFRVPLEIIFKQSVELKTGQGYELLRSFVLWQSDRHKNKEQTLKDLTKHLQNDPNNKVTYVNRGNIYRDNKKYHLALQDYNKAISIDPHYFEVYLHRGRLYSYQEKHYKAERDYTKTIELNPSMTEAYTYRGALYGKLKEYSKAEKDLSKVIELDPSSANAYYTRGFLYNDFLQYSKAEKDYTKAISLDSKLVKAYIKRGHLYNHINNYKKAEKDYTKAIELNPSLPVHYSYRGNIYLSQKKYKKAERDYNKAIKLNSSSAIAFTNRGFFYTIIKQYKKAEKDFVKAIKLDPKYTNAYYSRAYLHTQQKKYIKAKNYYTKTISLDPKYTQAYLERGHLYYEQKDYSKAEKDYTKAINLGTSIAEVYSNRANIFFIQQKYSKAEKDFTQAIKLDPSSVTYNERAAFYINTMQHEKAEKDCNKAIKLDSSSADIYCNRAIIHLAYNRHREAERDYNKALKLSPSAMIYYNRGIFYTNTGQYKRAEKDFTKAINLDPSLSLAYSNRALTYLAQGRYNEAKKDNDKAIELDPSSAQAYVSRGGYYSATGQYRKAEKDYSKAIKLQPGLRPQINNIKTLFSK